MRLTLLTLIALTFSPLAYSQHESESAQKTLKFKEASKTTPLEGQYLFISHNAFFLEGKVLSRESFLQAIKTTENGNPTIGLSAIKGSSIEDHTAIMTELQDSGYSVCASSHAVDLNKVYLRLAKANQSL